MQSHCHKTPRRHPDWCHRQLFPSTPTRTYPSCYSVGGALRGACLMRQRPTNGAWVPRSFKLRFGTATSAASCFHTLIVGTGIVGSLRTGRHARYISGRGVPPSHASLGCLFTLHPAREYSPAKSHLCIICGQGVLLSHFYCLCFAYVWPGSTPQPCASGSLVCVPGRGVSPAG